jgi:hypothetical protein
MQEMNGASAQNATEIEMNTKNGLKSSPYHYNENVMYRTPLTYYGFKNLKENRKKEKIFPATITKRPPARDSAN